MGILNKLILSFIFLFFKIKCDPRKVINTCGNIGYRQPSQSDECKENNQICCYVSLQEPDTGNTVSFCVSSPSDIEIGDVKDEIKDYTGFTILDLKCNKSQYIYNSIMVSLLLIFILF